MLKIIYFLLTFIRLKGQFLVVMNVINFIIMLRI